MKKKWARVIDGKVTEYRDYDLEEIPEHKRHLWSEVVEERPKFNPLYQELKGPESVVQDDKIIFKYYILDLSDNRLKDMVREEADRRIEKLFPVSIKPRYSNMLVKTKKGEQLTKKEQKEFDKIESVFPTLEDIRKCQERLQDMTPIPKDYADDKYWI